jgi:hypothetical protein
MEKIPTAKLFRETKLMDSSKPYTEEEMMIEFAKLHIIKFADEIKHGDEEHQQWLINAAEDYAKKIK